MFIILVGFIAIASVMNYVVDSGSHERWICRFRTVDGEYPKTFWTDQQKSSKMSVVSQVGKKGVRSEQIGFQFETVKVLP